MRFILAFLAICALSQSAFSLEQSQWGAQDLRRELISWFQQNGREAPEIESIGPLDPRLSLTACSDLAIVPRSASSTSFVLSCTFPVAWRYVLKTDVAAVFNRLSVANAQEPSGKRWPVVLSKTSLSVGMILTADVLEATFVANPPSGQALKSLHQSVGMRLTAGLNSGAVLTTRNVARAPLVLKGETVSVMAGGQGFEIATAARAEEDGYEGDLISVKNSRTGATMKGRLERNKTVTVLKL